MKRETWQQHAQIINDALYYMYHYLDSDITLEQLAKASAVTPHHFHRIFKEQLQESFYHKLQSIRLQKAANLLITNHFSSISEIANLCGYASHSSFIRVFKERFTLTPSAWRKGGYKEYSHINISHSPYLNMQCDFSHLEPRIEKSEAIQIGYLRHKGYKRSIKEIWQKLHAYCLEADMSLPRQIGIHHDNPSIVPLDECAYVAGIELDEHSPLNKKLSTFTIPKSLCAVFYYKGEYGEVLNLIRHIYHAWLPKSGYEAKTLPPYVIYHKNHFLDPEEVFELDFYLPIKVI
jgi:AraC family transcriptional regulator